MDARFAGSQKLGERRRRRLAVESDEPAELADGPRSPRSPDGESSAARCAATETDTAAPLLPLTGLVPVAWWKHLVGGGVLALVAAGLLAAWRRSAAWSAIAGPGFARLFAGTEPPAVTWFSALLLLVGGQLAFLVWWGRSRSQKDFAGRYRIWRRTAACLWLGSFAVATGAQHAFSETLCWQWPVLARWGTDVVWLAPVALVGGALLAALNRETSDCLASRSALWIAAICYLVGGGLRLPVAAALPDRELLALGAPLAGHLALWLCFWLHARHVLHFCAEPSAAPPRRRWIPRPHFRIPRLNWNKRPAAVATDSADTPAPTPGRKRARKLSAPEPTDEPAAASAASARQSPHPSDAAPPRRSADNLAPRSEIPPAAVPPRAADAPAARQDQERDTPVTPRHEATAPASAEPPDDAEESGWTEPFPKPDMRGMSKKQRRRLMQELREKERAARREE